MDLQEQIDALVAEMKCYNCKAPTDRFILFNTIFGPIEAFECLDCRQSRVQAKVDAGLRPASDLEPESLPETRNPA